MQPFKTLSSIAVPLRNNSETSADGLMANVDTDMIIPKQFLKTVSREGLSKGLFYELKTKSDGSPDPEFVLNQPRFDGAEILIAGDNFGCGSSREHAPWALLDQGIRCVIAPSFADIFFNNCFKNGILPIELPQEIVDELGLQAGGANSRFDIDLEAQTLTTPEGKVIHFEIDEGRKHDLLEGLDEIGISLKSDAAISKFEEKRKAATPWLG